ncbi:DUF4150 domain-containing protein [Mesorhizobium abyssinicae]|uniref:DUF4150 domain-containing protein n=1 Tax=Mesorhizobium abyssinicae TaxID=1209958 RepID=UPI003393A654
MGDVYANGLEISGKAVNAKTIAVFPDVCFTPPENPATPPGVPIPYPSFGMASDTEQGTGTVKIGGETVNIKNKSDLSRTSGTEAGCAAKKGVITSKNTGKEYFNSWSNDVKFDGEPVIRMTDLATNNHASPTGNTVTWPHMAKLKAGRTNCKNLLNKHKIRLHQHSKAKCPPGQESEHFIRVGCFQSSRRKNKSFTKWKNYNNKTAPCICMPARKRKPGGGFQSGPGAKTGTAHNKKTNQEADFFRKQKAKKKKPTLRNAMEKSLAAVAAHDPTIKGADDKTKEKILECLRLVMINYLQRVVRPRKTQAQLNAMTVGR